MIRLAAALCLISSAALAQSSVPEPEGFRGEPYNAPVPATLQGANVIDGPAAVRMHESGVPFLDVHPRQTRPEGLPEGTIWNEPAHDTIPGAVWLWNTGYDRLADVELTRLKTGLETATQGDPAAPIVIFCRADCWMSWNASRRAVEMGYSGVAWFPGGTDEWQQIGASSLAPAVPVTP